MRELRGWSLLDIRTATSDLQTCDEDHPKLTDFDRTTEIGNALEVVKERHDLHGLPGQEGVS